MVRSTVTHVKTLAAGNMEIESAIVQGVNSHRDLAVARKACNHVLKRANNHPVHTLDKSQTEFYREFLDAHPTVLVDGVETDGAESRACAKMYIVKPAVQNGGIVKLMQTVEKWWLEKELIYQNHARLHTTHMAVYGICCKAFYVLLCTYMQKDLTLNTGTSTLV
ncbi:hypothetical protein R1sor_027586 [Riccia sorocarpa]|uniref:Uncharacterized protein n=1 Tax=Riccia sorocarpa TaxID=122646 RepID=A0ABD3GEL5_9MARC